MSLQQGSKGIVPTENKSTSIFDKKQIIPPTSLEGEILTINGLVEGVIIESFNYNESNKAFVIDFKQLSTGNTHGHWVNDPDHSEYIFDRLSNDPEKQQKTYDAVYELIYYYCRQFDYPSKLDLVRNDQKGKLFKPYTEAMLTHVIGLHKQESNVNLKLTFKEPFGIEPKYVSDKYCIGTNAFPKFELPVDNDPYNNKYKDIIEFKFEQKIPDTFIVPPVFSNNLELTTNKPIEQLF